MVINLDGRYRLMIMIMMILMTKVMMKIKMAINQAIFYISIANNYYDDEPDDDDTTAVSTSCNDFSEVNIPCMGPSARSASMRE